jgi:hypothetical protein
VLVHYFEVLLVLCCSYEHLPNHLGAPLLIEGFPTIPRAWHVEAWFGRSQLDGKNTPKKKTTFLDTLVEYQVCWVFAE